MMSREEWEVETAPKQLATHPVGHTDLPWSNPFQVWAARWDEELHCADPPWRQVLPLPYLQCHFFHLRTKPIQGLSSATKRSSIKVTSRSRGSEQHSTRTHMLGNDGGSPVLTQEESLYKPVLLAIGWRMTLFGVQAILSYCTCPLISPSPPMSEPSGLRTSPDKKAPCPLRNSNIQEWAPLTLATPKQYSPINLHNPGHFISNIIFSVFKVKVWYPRDGLKLPYFMRKFTIDCFTSINITIASVKSELAFI